MGMVGGRKGGVARAKTEGRRVEFRFLEGWSTKGSGIQLPINLQWDETAQVYVATTPKLENIYSQGKTKQEARSAFEDATNLFFDRHFERGTFEELLERLK